MSKRNDPVDLIAYIRSLERRVDALDKRARRANVSGLPAGSVTDTELADNAAYDNLVSSGNTFDETFLNLTPQFDSAGTSSLAITATTTGTAHDTGLALTPATTGDYMIWSNFAVGPGSGGNVQVELRIGGTVVRDIQLGTSTATSNLVLAGGFVWFAADISNEVKLTAFRNTANGTFYGQFSTLMMQRVGP